MELGVSDSGDLIDVKAVETIHQIEHQQDGYIGLCRKANDGWHNMAGVPVHQLREYLPQLLPFLLEDAYFTVNAAWKAKPWSNADTGLPVPCRRESDLRYLNACYVDLDIYKGGEPLGLWEAMSFIGKAQDENKIPPASIIGRSGRGVYMLWLLNNGRQGAMQRAFPAEIALYKRVNAAIQEVLHKLEPRLEVDPIKDAARVLRLPGSINSSSPTRDRVEFLIQATRGKGIAPSYSLAELAEELGVRNHIYPTGKRKQVEQDFYSTMFENGRPIKNRGSCPARRKGRLATGQYRLEDLKVIEQVQGGFKQGSRRQSIMRFAHFAKAAGWTLSDIVEEAKSIGANCSPAYPSDKSDSPVAKIVDEVWISQTKQWRNDDLAKFFGVTHDFAEEHGLHSIIPASTKAIREALPSSRTLAREARREAILGILRDHPGRLPSSRELASSLEALGHKTSHETARVDLEAVLPLHRAEMTR